MFSRTVSSSSSAFSWGYAEAFFDAAGLEGRIVAENVEFSPAPLDDSIQTDKRGLPGAVRAE